MKPKISDEQASRLYKAVWNGDQDQVKLLLAEGVAPDAIPKHGIHDTPLLCAVARKHDAIVPILLAAGANINRRSGPTDTTPIHAAVSNQQWDTVTMLLAHGAQPNTPDHVGNTSAHHLIAASRRIIASESDGEALVLNILTKLLDAGLDPNLAPNYPTVFQHAITCKAPVSVLNLLHERGARLDYRSTNGLEPIHCAASSNNVPALEFLLTHGASPNALDAYGGTPLHSLAGAAAGKVLLAHGADLDRTDAYGRTAVTDKVRLVNTGEMPEGLRFLIDAGANLEIADHNGETALDIMKRRRLGDIKMYLSAKTARTSIRSTAAKALSHRDT